MLVVLATPATANAAAPAARPSTAEVVTPLADFPVYLDTVRLKNYHDGKCLELHYNYNPAIWLFFSGTCGSSGNLSNQLWYRYYDASLGAQALSLSFNLDSGHIST